MNYTDLFFSFPIKIYDKNSVRELIKKAKEDRKNKALFGQEDDDEVELDEPDWHEGFMYTTSDDILGWEPAFSTDQNVKEVKKRGFDYTMVETGTWGPTLCLWNVEKFMEALNEQKAKEEEWGKKAIVKKPKTEVY